MLPAIEVPPVGGETELADRRAGYDCLDEATRAEIADLFAYHSLYASQRAPANNSHCFVSARKHRAQNRSV
ncbi:MAG: hypothetical protein GKR94_31075 [Gammaproteobacteria bacterium]|nr:hypothetical protein [Gammaproteobacteria bacterium]